MSRIYLITEAEIQRLREGLELSKLRQGEDLGPHDPKRIMLQDMHRSFNYHVCNWINEVTKP